jgi:hypothetical protein
LYGLYLPGQAESICKIFGGVIPFQFTPMWWEHHNNKVGKTCNIGGFNKWNNTDLMRLLYKLIAEKLGR